MKTLCPFFKEDCHGNECVMWKNEECLLVTFLQRIQEGVPTPEENIPSSEETIEGSGMTLHAEKIKAPKWLETSTPEELALEILDFKKKEFPEREYMGSYTMSRYFWSDKGIERSYMPLEVQMKIEKAEMLAEREIRNDVENQRKKRLEKEKEELPSLVSQCSDFARMNNLKRLTLPDVDTFIMEKNLDLMHETRRAMYAMANFKLKSGK
jgi:hypothetical protein